MKIHLECKIYQHSTLVWSVYCAQLRGCCSLISLGEWFVVRTIALVRKRVPLTVPTNRLCRAWELPVKPAGV